MKRLPRQPYRYLPLALGLALGCLALLPAPAPAQTTLKCGLVTNGGGRITGSGTTFIGSLGQNVTGFSVGSPHRVRHGAWPCRYGQVIGVPEDIDPTVSLPLAMAAAYPNPFGAASRAGTTIRFQIPRDAGRVTLKVYDINARLVSVLADAAEPGEHEVHWSGRDARGAPVASGVYYVALKSRDKTLTQKLVYLK